MVSIKHSKLGIISFILSLLPMLFIGIPILIDALLPLNRHSEIYGYISMILANILYLVLPTLLLSMATGLAGLHQKNCKKTFVKTGLIIALAQLLGIAMLYIWATNQHFS